MPNEAREGRNVALECSIRVFLLAGLIFQRKYSIINLLNDMSNIREISCIHTWVMQGL